MSLAGCSGGHAPSLPLDATADGYVNPGPCWPATLGPPSGSAMLGTGRTAFEAMPDTLPLEYGSQDGYDLVANVRMSGFTPGNPRNILDPSNPRTRIRAFFADTNVPLNYYAYCPFRDAYVPTGAGDYQLAQGEPIIFETCWRSDHLIGARIRIDLELMDGNGNYVTDSKTVTAAAPMTPYPIEQDTPGCVHVADF